MQFREIMSVAVKGCMGLESVPRSGATWYTLWGQRQGSVWLMKHAYSPNLSKDQTSTQVFRTPDQSPVFPIIFWLDATTKKADGEPCPDAGG